MLKTSIKVYEYHTSLNRSIKKKFHCVVNHNVDQFSILNTDQQSTHTLKKGSCYIMYLFDIPAILIIWHLKHCRLINKKTIATWCFSNYIILQSLGSSYGKHPLKPWPKGKQSKRPLSSGHAWDIISHLLWTFIFTYFFH